MIFVDTGAWFAAFIPNDSDHTAASQWLSENREPLVTTDYVIDELLTLLRARGEFARAGALGDALLRGDIAEIHWVTPDDVLAAWNVFRRFHDKAWSFTDCVSRSVMERRQIDTAFAFDDHFRQFGTVQVVP
ncbi:MAG: PIN domain-containing protein [Pirellulaceae bacterium]